MSMNVSDIKNWNGLINHLDKVQQTDKTGKAPAMTEKELNSLSRKKETKSLGVPHRAAPKASESAQVKAGVERLSTTEVEFSIETLITMLFDLALEQRRARRESRMADASVAEEMGMAAADDIHNEAVMSITGSVLGATAQVAGAATVIGGGIRTAKSQNVMDVSNKMMTYQSSSQVFGSVGQMGKGGFDYQAKEDEAQKAIHDASATQAKSIEDSENEDQKDEAQLVQSIIQLQQQQEESRHEAARATA